VIYDFETFRTGGIVDTTNVNDLFELGRGVITEEVNHGKDGGGSNEKRKFVLVNGESLNELWKNGHEVLTVLVKFAGDILSGCRRRRS